ncbi:MAG: hypothetical protein FJY65_06050 [Calditrichaeota bacterium]|nr:hypothetical protein [Calditrichota bacterium]
MLEDLNYLVRLQQIDDHLAELLDEKGDLPEQLTTLKREIDKYEEFVRQTEHNLAANLEIKRQRERIIEEARERLKKSQATIFSVKTTREYDAISSEIEQAKSQIAESERLLIEVLNRDEEQQGTVVQHKKRLELVKSEYDERHKEMQERFDDSQEEEHQLQNERGKIIVKLKKPVYAHYERIRKIRDGVGVSTLSDGACSYCFSMIPPQRQSEVRRMDDIILCEVCGCILVANKEMNNPVSGFMAKK